MLVFHLTAQAQSIESKEISSVLFFPTELQKTLESSKTQDATEQTRTVPSAKLKIDENIQSEVAKKNFQRKALLFSGLYGKSNSPYRGAISKTLRCENPEAQPQKVIKNTPTEEIISYKFFTNDYFALGACEKRDLKYLGMVTMVYCKKSNIFAEISILDTLNSKAVEQVSLIRCL